MSSKQSFRSWVRNLPEPVAFVAGDARILMGKGAYRMAAAEQAIRAKDPDQVDAVNKDGEVIRTFVFRAAPVEDDEEEAVPVAPLPPADASSALLIHFSTLISKAYAQGAADHAAAYTESHAQVVSLCNGVLTRCAALEKLLNQMMRDVRLDANAAREELEEVREEIREAQEEAAGGGGAPGKSGVGGLVETIVKSRIAAAIGGAGAGPEKTNGATQ